MSPDVEFLVRQSLAVRSIAGTHALLSRSLFPAPSMRAICKISASIGRRTVAPEPAPVSARTMEHAAVAALSCDALLRRQLETLQVPSWPALVEHWTRHGRPSVSEALAA